MVLIGESAGGSLVLSMLNALKDKGIQMPKAAVSISPVTDLTCSAESFSYNAKKDIAPMNSWSVWTRMYIGEADPKEPWLSPQLGDLKGLPDMLLYVGSHEIHLDDTRSYAKRATEAGVHAKLRVVDGMIHAFPLLSPFFPEAKDAMSEICRYVVSALE